MRIDDGSSGGNAPPLAGGVLDWQPEPGAPTSIDAMLVRAIEVHGEWLAGLEASLGQAIFPEHLHQSGNSTACGLGQLLDREDFQSRLPQHRFAEIFCEHMFFHETAGELVHALSTRGRTPEVDRLLDALKQSSKKLVGFLSMARN